MSFSLIFRDLATPALIHGPLPNPECGLELPKRKRKYVPGVRCPR